MNRHSNLIASLRSWLHLNVNEIILVDWSSEVKLSDALTSAGITDDRIKVIRVEGETQWILTYAFNVGLRAVSFQTTYKLDADISVTESFLDLNKVEPGQLVRGLWKKAFDSGKKDQMYVNGSFGCLSQDLEDVGYYNEFIRTYGWDDSDLYYRLSEYCGLETKHLSIESVHHLEQAESERTQFQQVNNGYFLNLVRPTIFSNSVNRVICALSGDWSADKAQTFGRCKDSSTNGTKILRRTSNHLETPEWIITQASNVAAWQFINKLTPTLASRYSYSKLLSEWLFREYQFGEQYELSAALIGNFFRAGVEVFDKQREELPAYLGYSKAAYILIQGEQRDTFEARGKSIICLSNDDLTLVNELRNLAGYSQISATGAFLDAKLKQEIQKLTED